MEFFSYLVLARLVVQRCEKKKMKIETKFSSVLQRLFFMANRKRNTKMENRESQQEGDMGWRGGYNGHNG